MCSKEVGVVRVYAVGVFEFRVLLYRCGRAGKFVCRVLFEGAFPPRTLSPITTRVTSLQTNCRDLYASMFLRRPFYYSQPKESLQLYNSNRPQWFGPSLRRYESGGPRP